MLIPDWADLELSQDLSVLRARGEGQGLEYMESFPQQARDLAKEIAAFASSNPGTILLGVSNPGDLVGLADADSPSARDALLRRVEGICSGTVKPAITPSVKWTIEDARTVMVIQVPKGAQPVYYSNGIPYIRHLSESRPAQPHEVIERVQSWLPTQVDQEANDSGRQWLNELASLVIEALVLAEETDDRDVNPWLDQWRAQYRYSASRLRELAADSVAVEQGHSDDITALADALDSAASFRLYLGCGPDFSQKKQNALNLLCEFKRKYLDSVPLSETSTAKVRGALQRLSRQLRDLTVRMGAMIDQGEVEDVQAEGSKYGLTLLTLSHYPVDSLNEGLSDQLRTVGRELHLVETMPLYLDGGLSMRAVAQRIDNAAGQLEELVHGL